MDQPPPGEKPVLPLGLTEIEFYEPEDFERLVEGAAKADGALHKLRHTFGARLAMAGVPATTIMRLMGHADLATTQRYLHLTPTHMESAIRQLEHGDILETGTRLSLAENGGARKNPASGTTEAGRCW